MYLLGTLFALGLCGVRSWPVFAALYAWAQYMAPVDPKSYLVNTIVLVLPWAFGVIAHDDIVAARARRTDNKT